MPSKRISDRCRRKKPIQQVKCVSTVPPNPLSIFNAGYDKRVGNQVRGITYVCSIAMGCRMAWGRIIHLWICSFLWILFFIFEVILSLLALIFAYDTLAGEYERGTLRLVLTSHVRRGYILLAKYISAMICLLVPIANKPPPSPSSY